MTKSPRQLPDSLSSSPNLGLPTFKPFINLTPSSQSYQGPEALRYRDPASVINNLGSKLPFDPSGNRAPAPRLTPQQQAHERYMRLNAMRQALAASMKGSFPAITHPDGSVTSRDPGFRGTPIYNAILQNGSGLKFRRWDPQTDTTTAYFNDGSYATFGNARQGGKHLDPHQIAAAKQIAAMKSEFASDPKVNSSNLGVLGTMTGDGFHSLAGGIDDFHRAGAEGAENLNSNIRYWVDSVPGTWRANAIHKYQELTGTLPPPQPPSISRPDPWRDFSENPTAVLVKSGGGLLASTIALPGAVASIPVQVGRATKSAVTGNREQAINTMYDLGVSNGAVPTALTGVLGGGYQAAAGRTEEGKKTAQDALGKLFGNDLPADPYGTVLSGAPFYHGVGILGDLRRGAPESGAPLVSRQSGESEAVSRPSSTDEQNPSGERSTFANRKVATSQPKPSQPAYSITEEDANTALAAIKAQTAREKTHAALSSLDEDRMFNNAAIYGAYKLIKNSGKILWPDWQNQMATEVGAWTNQSRGRLWEASNEKYRHSSAYEGQTPGKSSSSPDTNSLHPGGKIHVPGFGEMTVVGSSTKGIDVKVPNGSTVTFKHVDAERFFPKPGEHYQSDLDFAKSRFRKVAEEALGNPSGKNFTVAYAKVNPHVAEMVKKETGLDIAGLTHEADSSGIKHAFNRHSTVPLGDTNSLPLTMSDFERVPEVTSNPDRVGYGGKSLSGNDQIVYAKKVNGHTIIYEQIRNGKGGRLGTSTVFSVKTLTPELWAKLTSPRP